MDPYSADDIKRKKDKSFFNERESVKGFELFTNQFTIQETNFKIQFGLINGNWASQLLRDNRVIDSYVYKEEDNTVSGFPNQNLIAGWVMRTVAIPNINPHEIMKLIQIMTKQIRETLDWESVKEGDASEQGRITDMARRLIKIRNQAGHSDDRFPFPYIFKPPEPPDDIGVATNVQRNRHLSEEEPDVELFCLYCGSKLVMDERFCSVCGKKF